ncbi:hypothetical protein OY671_010345, partial [Metschnikowia pulcherrima]
PERRAASRSGRHGHQGRAGARGRQGRRGRPCRRGPRHQYRAARHVPVARRRHERRHRQGNAGLQRQPPVRLGPAGHRLGAPDHSAGRRRDRHRRGRREHEPRALHRAGAASGRAHGRQRHAGHDDRRAVGSVRAHAHGRDRRERRGPVRHQPPGPGRARRRIASPRRQRHRGRLFPRPD